MWDTQRVCTSPLVICSPVTVRSELSDPRKTKFPLGLVCFTTVNRVQFTYEAPTLKRASMMSPVRKTGSIRGCWVPDVESSTRNSNMCDPSSRIFRNLTGVSCDSIFISSPGLRHPSQCQRTFVSSKLSNTTVLHSLIAVPETVRNCHLSRFEALEKWPSGVHSALVNHSVVLGVPVLKLVL